MKVLELELHTSGIEPMQAFYRDLLELPVKDLGQQSFAVQVGTSRLLFRQSKEDAYYHFAFNIYPEQFMEAREWLRSRLRLLEDEGSDIIDFPNWNAQALYFLDPAGNVVEFIARRDLQVRTSLSFHPRHGLISISEIGLPVDDVQQTFKSIQEASGIPLYSGGGSKFLAAGDPEGLFIMVDRHDKIWYPTDQSAQSFPWRLRWVEAGRQFTWSYPGAGLFAPNGSA